MLEIYNTEERYMDSSEILDMIKCHSSRVVGCVSGIDLEAFGTSEDIRDICAFNITRLGKFINLLKNEYKYGFPVIKWGNIEAMGVLLLNVYHKVDVKELWETVCNVVTLYNNIDSVIERREARLYVPGSDVAAVVKETLEVLFSENGVRSAVLYGDGMSCEDDSDIKFRLCLDCDHKGWDFIGLQDDIHRELAEVFVDCGLYMTSPDSIKYTPEEEKLISTGTVIYGDTDINELLKKEINNN